MMKAIVPMFVMASCVAVLAQTPGAVREDGVGHLSLMHAWRA